jgi:hypothetical protein
MVREGRVGTDDWCALLRGENEKKVEKKEGRDRGSEKNDIRA